MKKIVIMMLLLGTFLFPYQVNATQAVEGTVEFEPYSGITSPVNPRQTQMPIHPIDANTRVPPINGQNGPLSVDFASSFNFGVNKISNQDQTYFAEAQLTEQPSQMVTPYVQISDNRGTLQGWNLTLKQLGQLTSIESVTYQELSGARILLSSPHVNGTNLDCGKPVVTNRIALDPSGAETVILTAQEHAGAGTWALSWGELKQPLVSISPDQKEKRLTTNGIALEVPGRTPKSETSYHTELLWTLKETPNNH